jgi:hypothetical protein
MFSCFLAGCDAAMQWCAIGFPAMHHTEPCAGRFCRKEGAARGAFVVDCISYNFITLPVSLVGHSSPSVHVTSHHEHISESATL